MVIRAPGFVLKAMHESFVLKNRRTIGNGTPRHTDKSAVDVTSRSAVEVTSFEVESSQEAPEVGIFLAHQTLVCSNASNVWFLKCSQNPLHDLGGPDDIVVGQKSDLSLHLGQSPAYLSTLVGLLDAKTTDTSGVNTLGEFLQFLEVDIGGNEKNLVRVGLETFSDGLFEFLLSFVENGGNNYGNVVWEERRDLWQRNWLECSKRNTINNQSKVPINPEERNVSGTLQNWVNPRRLEIIVKEELQVIQSGFVS
jgi:hypothetical protein